MPLQNVLRALDRWHSRIADDPDFDETLALHRQWDWDQTNDQEFANEDPFSEVVTEALALRDEDPAAGVSRLIELAEQGSTSSLRAVAYCYTNGLGVQPDEDEAERWDRRAMEAGSLSGLLECGRHCWRRQDWDGCERVYGVGAGMGWAPAMYWLARVRLHRSKSRATLNEVRPLLEGAAAKGSLAAQKLLSYHLILGHFGLREVPRGWRMAWLLATVETMMWRSKRVAETDRMLTLGEISCSCLVL